MSNSCIRSFAKTFNLKFSIFLNFNKNLEGGLIYSSSLGSANLLLKLANVVKSIQVGALDLYIFVFKYLMFHILINSTMDKWKCEYWKTAIMYMKTQLLWENDFFELVENYTKSC